MITSNQNIMDGVPAGAFILVLGLINLLKITHTVWFSIISIIILISLTYAGAKINLKILRR